MHKLIYICIYIYVVKAHRKFFLLLNHRGRALYTHFCRAKKDQQLDLQQTIRKNQSPSAEITGNHLECRDVTTVCCEPLAVGKRLLKSQERMIHQLGRQQAFLRVTPGQDFGSHVIGEAQDCQPWNHPQIRWKYLEIRSNIIFSQNISEYHPKISPSHRQQITTSHELPVTSPASLVQLVMMSRKVSLIGTFTGGVSYGKNRV